MQTVASIDEVRRVTGAWRQQGLQVAFVPTMGNLHAGHLQLIDYARSRADRTVVSIFVNPMQFGPSEDFAAYPRTLEQDSQKLMERGAELLFVPTVAEMYPGSPEQSTRVVVPGISDVLCGAVRPGHFTGVATVVNKLLNMVHPHVAVFGEKDFQQLLVVSRMVRDLNLPVVVEGVPTVRDPDGLAMSSRNNYLTEAERRTAPELYRQLCRARERLVGGDTDFPAIEKDASEALTAAGLRPEYVAVRRARDLGQPAPHHKGLVVLAAAWLGRARLIDNVRVNGEGT